MKARDWFESIEAEGKRIQKVKESLAMLESRIAPHSQGFEPMGHGGGRVMARPRGAGRLAGWSLPEVASHCGLSERTVRSMPPEPLRADSSVAKRETD